MRYCILDIIVPLIVLNVCVFKADNFVKRDHVKAIVSLMAENVIVQKVLMKIIIPILVLKVNIFS